MEELIKEVKAIMNDLDTDCLIIDCCAYKVKGALLTHCYYNEETDKFHFTSGDMEEDKQAEEILVTYSQMKEILSEIIECY